MPSWPVIIMWLYIKFHCVKCTFAGEVRLGITGPSYLIGAGASSTNTVEPGMVCMSKNNEEDTVKEGTTLSVLRLNSSEIAVKIGCRQALFIETANDGSWPY